MVMAVSLSTYSPVVKWHFVAEACFAVWTIFYGWFWFWGMSWAGISRVPLWHPWALFLKGKNKMAARYFKVKYNFYQMKPGTSVIPHFHVILTGKSIFLWLKVIFKVKKSTWRSNKQKIPFLTNKARNMCNTSIALNMLNIVWKCIYGIIYLIPGNLQVRKSFPCMPSFIC